MSEGPTSSVCAQRPTGKARGWRSMGTPWARRSRTAGPRICRMVRLADRSTLPEASRVVVKTVVNPGIAGSVSDSGKGVCVFRTWCPHQDSNPGPTD